MKLIISASPLLLLATLSFSANASVDGQVAYDKYCAMCHASGSAGAPKTGNKRQWEDRIAKGMDTLNHNAIHGFRGKRGYMPAKGGYAKVSDDDVKAAVEHMIFASQ